MTGKFGTNQNRNQGQNDVPRSSRERISVGKLISKNNVVKVFVLVAIVSAVMAIVLNFESIMDAWYYNVVLPLLSFLIPIILVLVVIFGVAFLLRARAEERRNRYRRWW